jgi:hypothetical protein
MFMHRLAYLNRGLMAAMIVDPIASIRYQASLPINHIPD